MSRPGRLHRNGASALPLRGRYVLARSANEKHVDFLIADREEDSVGAAIPHSEIQVSDRFMEVLALRRLWIALGVLTKSIERL